MLRGDIGSCAFILLEDTPSHANNPAACSIESSLATWCSGNKPIRHDVAKHMHVGISFACYRVPRAT